uniref:Uncharacterized protein n=1 Tax=Panagrolaimus sp. PS1159 TaxID=55785 RepID=A0AC35FVI1_9BILA
MEDNIPTFKDEDYPRGSIRKLVFHDFLTFNHLECLPGKDAGGPKFRAPGPALFFSSGLARFLTPGLSDLIKKI